VPTVAALLRQMESDDEVRKALGNKFSRPIWHAIVCIGALVARQDGKHWGVDALGSPHVGERAAKELITSFVERFLVIPSDWAKLSLSARVPQSNQCRAQRAWAFFAFQRGARLIDGPLRAGQVFSPAAPSRCSAFISRSLLCFSMRHPMSIDGQAVACPKAAHKSGTHRSLRYLELAALVPSAGTITP
jgi:hypothetical protein